MRLYLSLLLFLSPFLTSSAEAQGDVTRGRVVFALAGGCGCHTAADGPIGAGGAEIPTPFGKFFGTNITPDSETGIGSWSDAEIDAAIRRGVTRGRGVESPVMPYYLYAGMADEDAADLIAFLRSLPPVQRKNRVHEGEMPLARPAYRAWRLLFAPGATARRATPPAGVDRGRYFVDHISICGDCHTPRNRFGAPIARSYLAGVADGPHGNSVSNITPHSSGIGDWDVDDIVQLLRSGMLPNFDNVQGLMAEVIDGKAGSPGYKDLPPEYLRDIAAYLKTVPPIDNVVADK